MEVNAKRIYGSLLKYTYIITNPIKKRYDKPKI